MHTHTYRKQPYITREVFQDLLLRKGIPSNVCSYEFREVQGAYKGLHTYRPVAIERRSYADSSVALYAVIYRNCSTGSIRVKHAWGKVESIGNRQSTFMVGE